MVAARALDTFWWFEEQHSSMLCDIGVQHKAKGPDEA